MRVEAVIVAEQVSLVGVVHIDRVRIRHVDFHRTKGIEGAGLLAHREIRSAGARPVHRSRIDRNVVRIEHLHVHAGEIAGILAHVRRDFGFRNRGRNGPGRIEDDAGDFGGQRRRRLFGLADDDPITPHHMIVFDRFGKGRGQVHDDVALPKCEIHIAEAFERGFELLDPLLHGDVECCQRTRGHGSRWREAVARLETLHALGDNVVVRTGFIGGEIAADQETLAQQIVLRSLHAESEFGIGGNHRPSAAYRKIRITQCGFLDPLRGSLVEGRLMRQRQRGRGTGLRRGCDGRLDRYHARGRLFPAHGRGDDGFGRERCGATGTLAKGRRTRKHGGNGNDCHCSHVECPWGAPETALTLKSTAQPLEPAEGSGI